MQKYLLMRKIWLFWKALHLLCLQFQSKKKCFFSSVTFIQQGAEELYEKHTAHTLLVPTVYVDPKNSFFLAEMISSTLMWTFCYHCYHWGYNYFFTLLWMHTIETGSEWGKDIIQCCILNIWKNSHSRADGFVAMQQDAQGLCPQNIKQHNVF